MDSRYKAALVAAILACGAIAGLAATQPSAEAGNKITICHFPPGNPGNFHTITVGSQKAADKHLEKHGDFLGPCCDLGETCDDGDACTANFCLDGACTSEPVACGDLPCMVNTGCDPTDGCQYEDVVCPAGQTCDPDAGENGECVVTCPCEGLSNSAGVTWDDSFEVVTCNQSQPGRNVQLQDANGNSLLANWDTSFCRIREPTFFLDAFDGTSVACATSLEELAANAGVTCVPF